MVKTKYWTKTENGYEHKRGFVLIHNVNEGLTSIGGLWTLVYDHFPLAYYPYTHHLCDARLFRWAAEEIAFYYRMIK